MSNEKPDLMVPPDVAHAMVRERDYREGYAAGMAEGAAAERARLTGELRAALGPMAGNDSWVALLAVVRAERGAVEAARARLVAVVRSHYIALFPGGDHRLDMILAAIETP